MSPLHRAALTYVRAGFKIFPCLPLSKVPACDHGFHDATDNEDQINDWWTSNPDYNIAFSPHTRGWGIVDIDSAEAAQNWYARTGDDPDTWTVRTPRKGLHIYYEGELPTSVGRLIPGLPVDTRGRGSYALLPPSRTPDGQYVVKIEADVEPLPAWTSTLLAEMRKGGSVASSDVEPDLPVNLRRAERWLRDREPAIEGAGGNEWTYRTAAALADMGLSEEAVLALMAGEWNDRCQPSWQDDELEGVVTNATRYRQNEGGQHAARDPREAFAGYLQTLASEPDRPGDSEERASANNTRSSIWLSEAEQDAQEEPAWLIPGLVPDQQAVMLYGPTQSYKSFIALDLALSVAAGVPTFAGAPVRDGPVFYAALEGRTGIMRQRRPAWKAAKGLVGTDIPFYVGPAPTIMDEDDTTAWEKETQRILAGRRCGAIFLDTVAKVMAGMNENDAKDMGRVIQWCDRLVAIFKCPVIAVHHTGRDATHSRGSSAADAGFNSVIVATADRPSKMVKVHVQKHKDAEEPEEPWYMAGRVFGGSLVFDPCTKAEYDAATRPDNQYGIGKVQRALFTLKAIGGNTVATHVLAIEMCETHDGTPEANKKVASAERTLARMASRDDFASYVTRNGAELQWGIPGPAPE